MLVNRIFITIQIPQLCIAKYYITMAGQISIVRRFTKYQPQVHRTSDIFPRSFFPTRGDWKKKKLKNPAVMAVNLLHNPYNNISTASLVSISRIHPIPLFIPQIVPPSDIAQTKKGPWRQRDDSRIRQMPMYVDPVPIVGFFFCLLQWLC